MQMVQLWEQNATLIINQTRRPPKENKEINIHILFIYVF